MKFHLSLAVHRVEKQLQAISCFSWFEQRYSYSIGSGLCWRHRLNFKLLSSDIQKIFSLTYTSARIPNTAAHKPHTQSYNL